MSTRNTIQRKLILDTVRSMCGHPDAEQIYSRIAENHPHISKATVYRNLHLLSEMGEIKKVCVSEGADRYDLRTDEHYHMRCRKCGRIFDAPDAAARVALSGATDGFEVESVNVELIGLCPDCKI